VERGVRCAIQSMLFLNRRHDLGERGPLTEFALSPDGKQLMLRLVDPARGADLYAMSVGRPGLRVLPHACTAASGPTTPIRDEALLLLAIRLRLEPSGRSRHHAEVQLRANETNARAASFQRLPVCSSASLGRLTAKRRWSHPNPLQEPASHSLVARSSLRYRACQTFRQWTGG